jgi:hypothetical protein
MNTMNRILFLKRLSIEKLEMKSPFRQYRNEDALFKKNSGPSRIHLAFRGPVKIQLFPKRTAADLISQVPIRAVVPL